MAGGGASLVNGVVEAVVEAVGVAEVVIDVTVAAEAFSVDVMQLMSELQASTGSDEEAIFTAVASAIEGTIIFAISDVLIGTSTLIRFPELDDTRCEDDRLLVRSRLAAELSSASMKEPKTFENSS